MRSSSHEAARVALKAIHGGNHENREGLPDELKNTDIGNGWRFSRQHGERFRYCREMNQYLAYDGKRWQPDQSAAEAAAKDTVRDMAAVASRDPGKPENKAPYKRGGKKGGKASKGGTKKAASKKGGSKKAASKKGGSKKGGSKKSSSKKGGSKKGSSKKGR